MNANIKNAAVPYLNELRRLPESLKQSFGMFKDLSPLPIDGHDVTAAILITLKTYYDVQDELMAFLNKRVKGAASDFFVETVQFYLMAFIETHNLPLTAVSEKIINLERGYIRPDISIWRGDKELVAVIECKTNLGWNRSGWKKDFAKREGRVHKRFLSAKCFLVVLTVVNWPGFGPDPKVGDQYFALSKVWPSDVDLDHVENSIRNPIEPLFRQIGALGRTMDKAHGAAVTSPQSRGGGGAHRAGVVAERPDRSVQGRHRVRKTVPWSAKQALSLKQRRRKLGLTQAQVGELTGVGRRRYSWIEYPKIVVPPRSDELECIVRVLKIDPRASKG